MATVSTRKRGSKWYYSIEATEYAANGKRKRIEKGGFISKKEAEEAGAKAQADLARGNVALLSEKISVKDYLNEWFEKKEKELRPNSRCRYLAAVKNAGTFFGDKCLQKLRPRDVEAYAQDMAKNGKARGTIGKELNILHIALSYAVFPMELLQVNPAQYIKVPKQAPAKVIDRYVIRGETWQKLIETYPFGHYAHIPIMLGYHTGMRLGEVLGLTWDNVDLEAHTIAVKRQLIRVNGNRLAPPKTQSSVRTIPIDEALTAVLKRWRKAQLENELSIGGAYYYAYEDKDGFLWHIPKAQAPGENLERRLMVCTNDKGKTSSGSMIMQTMRKCGLNFHSLRHTHATLCAENGAPLKGLAGRLGHTNTNLTANLYTHGTDKMQKETLEAFLQAKN